MDSATFANGIRARTNPDSSNRRGAERDAWLVRLASIGPLWVSVLVQIRLFRTRQAAERRLRKLELAGRLRHVGCLSIQGSRKSHIWCNRRFGDQLLKHEVDVMRVFLAYWPCAYALAGADVDPRWRSDMELVIGDPATGRRYMAEIDEETESLSQVRRRLDGYRDCPHTVLFIAPSPSRVGEVIRHTDNPRIYITTIDRCLEDPWGDHWRNCRGEEGHVAKPVA